MEEYTPKFNSVVLDANRSVSSLINSLYEVASHKKATKNQKEKCLDLITDLKNISIEIQSLLSLEEDNKADEESEKKDKKEAKSEADNFRKGFNAEG